MISFKKITIDDVKILKKYFALQSFRLCDYSPSSVFMWRDFYNYEYAVTSEMIIIKVNGNESQPISFLLPVGDGDLSQALIDLEEYCKENAIELLFSSVPLEGLLILDKYYIYNCEKLNDWSDYLYAYDDLVNLVGRKYANKRNNIHKFKKFSDYTYKSIDINDKIKLQIFLTHFNAHYSKDDVSFNYEKEKVFELINNFEKLDIIGGLIMIKDLIVAISFGEVVNDTLIIHVEKALREFEGSYEVMSNEFAKHNQRNDVKFINREEDVGDSGLKTAKLSYHPVKMLDKYLIKVMKKK